MKVKDLIEMLEDYDPEAEVLIATQPQWPFEHVVAGVVTRRSVDDEREGLNGSDVIISCGSQLRYGVKEVWDGYYYG